MCVRNISITLQPLVVVCSFFNHTVKPCLIHHQHPLLWRYKWYIFSLSPSHIKNRCGCSVTTCYPFLRHTHARRPCLRRRQNESTLRKSGPNILILRQHPPTYRQRHGVRKRRHKQMEEGRRKLRCLHVLLEMVEPYKTA